MEKPLYTHLSRRESQIMDVVYRLREASVADVVHHMPDEPAYNSVRVTLGILEKKGYVKHRQEGQRYLYSPVVPSEDATRSALRHMTKTFFRGSPSQTILTLLDLSSERLSEADLNEIAAWIDEARKKED
jgi:predicted transcriptional regulator